MFLSRVFSAVRLSGRSFKAVSAPVARLPSIWGSSLTAMSTKSDNSDKDDQALLEYFLKLDEKEAANFKPETPLPIKVSGISGGLAADLFRHTKDFDGVVASLAGLVNIVDSSHETVRRFFVHPNYSPEECQTAVSLLFTKKEALKDFAPIKANELLEVIVQSEANMADWLAARSAVKSAKVSPAAKELLDKLADMGRLDLLRRVAEITQNMKTAQSNTVPVTVASAVELSASQKKSVEAALPQYMDKGQKVDVSFEVDPGTLGGIMVTMGNRSIDLTAGTQLMESMQAHA
jgi:F0F1-type ATP synthase delta subunit